jgi:hypothetical protein
LSLHRLPASLPLACFAVVLSCIGAAALTACGGGDAMYSPVTIESALAAAVGGQALPTFRMAPARLDEPSDIDVGGRSMPSTPATTRTRFPT